MSLASDFGFSSGTLAVARTDKKSGSSGEIKRSIYLYTQKYGVQDKEV